MNQALFALFTVAMAWARPKYNVRLRFLEAQIRILRARVDASRIVPSPEEKAELLRLGAMLGHDVADLMHVVRPDSYRRWLRVQHTGKRAFSRLGRPPTPQAIRNLVLRIARENLCWGYGRIVGELKKLGIRIGATTVREILKDGGIHPGPCKEFKEPAIPWTTFVHAHMDSIVACDFFSKRILTLHGALDAYVLVFIHLGSRKVYCSPCTYHPDSAWVMQQARNASMWMEDEGFKVRFVVRDRDRKYPDAFDLFWKDDDVRCIRIPLKAPRANAFCESFIGTIKKECINHFYCFSRDQLDYIVGSWLSYYHRQRPHQGEDIGNSVLDETFVARREGAIVRRQQLGGIISYYEREAA